MTGKNDMFASTCFLLLFLSSIDYDSSFYDNVKFFSLDPVVDMLHKMVNRPLNWAESIIEIRVTALLHCGSFLAPSRSPRNANVRSSVCSMKVCLELSIFILKQSGSVLGQSQVIHRSVSGQSQSQVSLRSVSGQSQVSLRSVLGQS